MILRRALILSLLALAACGSPSTPPPADPDTLFPARFGDSDPVDFKGRTPQSFPVHGIDVARFQNNIDWNTARKNGVNFAFIKATEGGDLKDINFDTHWQGAGQAALLARGAGREPEGCPCRSSAGPRATPPCRAAAGSGA